MILFISLPTLRYFKCIFHVQWKLPFISLSISSRDSNYAAKMMEVNCCHGRCIVYKCRNLSNGILIAIFFFINFQLPPRLLRVAFVACLLVLIFSHFTDSAQGKQAGTETKARARCEHNRRSLCMRGTAVQWTKLRRRQSKQRGSLWIQIFRDHK